VDTITCTIEQFVLGAPNTVSCLVPADTPLPTDWWAAIGTVSATVVALVFGLVSLGFTLHERTLRRKQEARLAVQAAAEHRSAIRKQAERVAAWLMKELVAPPTTSGTFRVIRPVEIWRIVVQNASDQPIWEVGVTHWSLGHSQFAQIPVLAPGEKRELPCRPKPKSEGETLEEAVTVRFRDNAGRTWCRPGHVPGFLDLEQDTTFAELEGAEAPVYYRAQAFKTWVEGRWPKGKPKPSTR
jgi:hypothetical protein